MYINYYSFSFNHLIVIQIILDLITEKDIHIGRVLDDNVLTIPGVYIIALWTPGNTVSCTWLLW